MIFPPESYKFINANGQDIVGLRRSGTKEERNGGGKEEKEMQIFQDSGAGRSPKEKKMMDTGKGRDEGPDSEPDCAIRETRIKHFGLLENHTERSLHK